MLLSNDLSPNGMDEWITYRYKISMELIKYAGGLSDSEHMGELILYCHLGDKIRYKSIIWNFENMSPYKSSSFHTANKLTKFIN